MTWWPWRRRAGQPTEDARYALEHTHRQLADTQALGRAADDLLGRAGAVGDRWQEIKETNHVAAAAVASIVRKVRNP